MAIDPGPADDVVVYRPPRRAAQVFLALGGLWLVFAVGSGVAWGWDGQVALRALQGVAFAGAGAVMATRELRVDATGVTLRRGPWRRHVAWDRVERLEMADAGRWRFVPRVVVRDGRPLRIETGATAEGDDTTVRMVARIARAGVPVEGTAVTASSGRWAAAVVGLLVVVLVVAALALVLTDR